MFKKVVIKLSGEALSGNGNHFDDKVINRIVLEIIEVKKQGTQVSLVVGGGNFWRGRTAKSEMDNVKADQIGMLATVMNGIYLSEAFRLNGCQAKVMTPFIIGSMTEQFEKQKALEYLDAGKVIIFAGGTGHPFFSTDTIVALRANELEADAVLYAKNIDGVYDSNPHEVKTAKKFKTVSYKKIIQDSLDAADLAAMHLSRGENIPSLVFELKKPGSILSACTSFEGLYHIGGTLVSNHIEEEFYV